ncbi:hypothetical protein CP533_0338 [Ophiocordyceps camponoti-saundersi (nom. inval.)]|nr:hypothetical protein CP533_0338 [Ophiocordyceps camponoti-saundersi (nom. inval.)]
MAAGILRCAACLRKSIGPSSRLALPLGRGRRGYVTLLGEPLFYDISDPSFYPSAKEVAKEQKAVNSLAKTAQARLGRIVKKHLAHMKDPWKIGKYVESALADSRFDEALLLTQTVSQDHPVVVSWNHLIAYQMKKKRFNQAIKLFNDMKKRGQLPSVATYSIIFNGCAESDHPKEALAEAFKHYQYLLNCTRLRANTIHLNCMLKLCSNAGDIESLFLVAESINDTHRFPDSLTYGTILNALRLDASKRVEGLTAEQVAVNQQKAVDRAKSIWVEVLQKWKNGRLVMTEQLVCCMGRILLLDKSNPRPDVLDLLQTTMNIPNLIKGTDSDPFKDAAMLNIAAKLEPKKTTHAIPGRNALGLVIAFLTSTKHTAVGIKYWNLMVRHYGVIPDRDNWYHMLGMIKVAHASAHAADMLELLPSDYICNKPFKIAMETCVRDSANPNVFRNANRILDLMLRGPTLPDLHTLRLYLRVALIAHSDFRDMAFNRGKLAFAKRDYGHQIFTAVERVWGPYKRLCFHWFKVATRRPEGTDDVYNSQREVIALARAKYGAMNKLIEESLVPHTEIQNLRRRGAKINREIKAFYLNRDDIEPNNMKRPGHRRQFKSPSKPAGPKQDSPGSVGDSGGDESATDFRRESLDDYGIKNDDIKDDAIEFYDNKDDDIFPRKGEWVWNTKEALPIPRNAHEPRAPRASPSPSPPSSSEESASVADSPKIPPRTAKSQKDNKQNH